MRRALVLTALLLGGGCSSTGSERLSYARAEEMPSETLIRTAMEQYGRTFRDVELHSGSFDYGALTGLSLSTAPRSAGMPGLCEADVLTLQLRRTDPNSPWPLNGPYEDAEVAVQRGFRRTVYGTVGDTTPRDVDDEAQGRACAGLTSESFFGADDAPSAWLAVRLTEKLSSQAGRGDLLLGDFACRSELCADFRQVLVSVEPAMLISAETQRCAAGPLDEPVLDYSAAANCILLRLKVRDSGTEWTRLDLAITYDPGDTRAAITPDPVILEVSGAMGDFAE